MRLVHCACATDFTIAGAENHQLPAIPTRKDLRFLDEIAREVLPVDPTPSLQEIAASPSVSHLGEPAFAPQQPTERLRIIVSGSDAALSTILTRMMRADYLWAEIAYLPTDPSSPAAVLWGIPDDARTLALEGPVRPIPCIRNDAGLVVAGSATLTHAEDKPFIGEIVVDNDVLLRSDGRSRLYGARLVPTTHAPGLAAAVMRKPRFRKHMLIDATSTPSGRALQSGGLDIAVTVDGVRAKRPVERVTFYRHLRDIQAIRS
mgnify:CR=1 FL=1